MWEIRTYVRRARKFHRCDHCFWQIHPGDIYEGVVFVDSRGKFMELKEHQDPGCPFDPDEEREADEAEFREERDGDEEEHDEQFPEAA